MERLVLQPRHAAVPVGQVAEDDGPGGARRPAGREHLAVAHRSVFPPGPDLLWANALHAVGAFFHHAAAADRHLGIAHQAQAFRGEVGIPEEVEAADLVGAVVRAVARADAAVVDHVVETVAAVHRRAYGTDDLAGRVL